ncbi:putative sulfate exporter family transporter [bacterium]|nr:putative sulfate exporter family transporter [bacterium]
MGLHSITEKLPGLAAAGLIGWLAIIASRLLEQSTGLLVEAMVIGIMLGIIIGNTAGVHDLLKPGVAFGGKQFLEAAVVIVGFRMNFMDLAGIGLPVLLAVLLTVPGTLMLAIMLGRIFGLKNNLPLLLGVGTAICGSSAIAAVSPVIKASREESAVSISAINILSAIGVLVFTWLSYIVPLGDTAYGVWSGLSMQAVPTAIAAAGARGAEALETGTLVKMARVAMLVPVSIVISMLASRAAGAASEKARKVSMPLFIVLFLVAGIIRSLGLVPETGLSMLSWLSSTMLVIAMTAIGMSVNFAALRKSAGTAMGKGAFLFLILSVVSYFWCLFFLGH